MSHPKLIAVATAGAPAPSRKELRKFLGCSDMRTREPESPWVVPSEVHKQVGLILQPLALARRRGIPRLVSQLI
jgi:hypothetical protein